MAFCLVKTGNFFLASFLVKHEGKSVIIQFSGPFLCIILFDARSQYVKFVKDITTKIRIVSMFVLLNTRRIFRAKFNFSISTTKFLIKNFSNTY